MTKASLGSPFFVLFLLFAATSFAQDKQQRLRYDVTWGGKQVAKMELRKTCATDGRAGYGLTVKSEGLIDQFHAFETRFSSLVSDPNQGFRRSKTHIIEKDVPRTFLSDATPDGITTEKLYRKKRVSVTHSMPTPTHDLLTWIFALRSEALVKDKKRTFYVWDGWKLQRVETRVLSDADVYLPSEDKAISTKRVSVYRTVVDTSDPKIVKRKKSKLGTLYFRPSDQTLVGMDYKAAVSDAKIRLSSKAEKRCP